jgi:hypothetical protein
VTASLFWILFVAAIALLLAMVAVEWRRRQAHVADCEATAARLGATYSYDPPAELLLKVQGFDLTFADGASLPRSVRDVFTLQRGQRALYLFLHEHRGSFPGEAAGSAHRESVGCIVSPSLHLPRFRLSPERPLEKIASVLGLRDVDFASHPGFSRSYYLNTEDEAAARRLFVPQLLTFFENSPGWHVEGRGDTLVIYRLRRAAVGAEELSSFAREVEEIARTFGA